MPAFISKYKIIQKIGEGSFSEVLKCEDRISKELYAAKILKKIFQNTNDVLYCAEIIAMQKLNRHPNVLYMHEYFFEKSSGKLIFIFELMDMSMYEFMKAKKRCFPETKVKHYLFQMLKGLDYLHRHGLFHRDIKPENILVKVVGTSQTNQNELIKLADLGSIRGIYSKPPYTEYISTRWYRSPECLLTIGHYGLKMDIWATGCVFYEMLTMKPLFPGSNEIDQLARIHAVLGTPSQRLLSKLKSRSKNFTNFNKQLGSGLQPLISSFSDDAQTMLKLMLQYDPDIRSNARRLLQHRYFQAFREEERAKKCTKAYLAREYGDANNVLYSNDGRFKTFKQQFQSNSLKSIAKETTSKKHSLFSSKTVVELNPKLHQHLTLNLQKSKLKMPHKINVYRNTSTNLVNDKGKEETTSGDEDLTNAHSKTQQNQSSISLTKKGVSFQDNKKNKVKISDSRNVCN